MGFLGPTCAVGNVLGEPPYQGVRERDKGTYGSLIPLAAHPNPPPGRYRRAASLHVTPLSGARRTKACKSSAAQAGGKRGRFYFLRTAPVPARCNPFCFRRRGAFRAAAPAYFPAGSVPFAAALFRPPPLKCAAGPPHFIRSRRPAAFLPPRCGACAVSAGVSFVREFQAPGAGRRFEDPYLV